MDAIGMGGISEIRVSRLCTEIDKRINAFINRPLEGGWPSFRIDATNLKGRAAGRIASMAVVIAVAVNTEGARRVFGMASGPAVAEPFWTDFPRSLTRHGIRGVKLVISDAHERLKAAAAQVFTAT